MKLGALLGVVALLGFALGEVGGGIETLAYALLASLLLGVAGALRGSRRQRLLLGCGLPLLWLVACAAGQYSVLRAFNRCVTEGEAVRSALFVYRERYGRYPGSLGELPDNLPCGRLLLPSLLHYQQTGSGYALGFGDVLVQFTASESQPFEARK